MGPELSRDDAYLETSQSLTDSIFIYGLIMSMLPFRSRLRGLYDLIFSPLHRRVLGKAMAVIQPVIESRLNQFEGQDFTSKLGAQEQLDCIQWSLEYTRGNGKEHNPRWIGHSILHNIWAGSAAPGGLVTQMVFQVLMERPERYLEPLRKEAEAALEKHGGYTIEALKSMVLMDSLIRELNRVYPTGAITCARTVMSPQGFRTHDGLDLPRGARVAIPALAIQTDPEHFDDPLTVDGFRFARLREAEGAGSEQGWGAATASETNLA